MTDNDPYLSPHSQSSCLITIDVQRDFYEINSPTCVSGTKDMIPQIALLAKSFRAHSLPIVHIVRIYMDNGSNVDVARRYAVESGQKIVAPDSGGSQVASEILPKRLELNSGQLLAGAFQEITPNEFFLYKPRWGAFYKTDLEVFLSDRGIDTLIFCGCNFPNCPRASIYEASERDFRIILVEDATSQVYPKGLDECKKIGATILTTDETVRWLKNGSQQYVTS